MLYFIQCLTSFSSINHLLHHCDIFDSISSNIDELLSINPSANVFVFWDFNIHHKDWLNYSGGTDRPRELCYNFSISNDLTQIVNFPTRIPDCDSHSPALLDLFISSDASICSTMAFPPLGNSDDVAVSVYIDFPIKKNLKKNFMAPFYGWGSTASRLEPLRGGSLLFTTKFPEIPGTHFIDLGRMKG